MPQKSNVKNDQGTKAKEKNAYDSSSSSSPNKSKTSKPAQQGKDGTKRDSPANREVNRQDSNEDGYGENE